ncbi:MAG: hypothetical protein GKR89_03280 [Candidatus Latescibacteria bacterium]|nr:hypothetical protein [Candidatus Latescibacterota bacterium]
MRIRIAWDGGQAYARLDDTPTARQLQAVLPCRARAQTWGEEVYFDVPVDAALEADARQVVEPGAVCLWVEGGALALPFGPTPISQGSECRLVAPVNVLGALEGNPRVLAGVRAGDQIEVEAVD